MGDKMLLIEGREGRTCETKMLHLADSMERGCRTCKTRCYILEMGDEMLHFTDSENRTFDIRCCLADRSVGHVRQDATYHR